MRFVIDTNRIIAALIKDSMNRKVLFDDAFEFFTPQETLNEIHKYKDYIIEKAKCTDEEFEDLYQKVILKIHVIDIDTFKQELDGAEQIMKKIDIKDKWFIAVGLALHLDGIWTEDKHFACKSAIITYSTESLHDIARKNNIYNSKKED